VTPHSNRRHINPAATKAKMNNSYTGWPKNSNHYILFLKKTRQLWWSVPSRNMDEIIQFCLATSEHFQHFKKLGSCLIGRVRSCELQHQLFNEISAFIMPCTQLPLLSTVLEFLNFSINRPTFIRKFCHKLTGVVSWCPYKVSFLLNGAIVYCIFGQIK